MNKINIILTPEEEKRERSIGDKSGWQSWLSKAIDKINETSKKSHMVGGMNLSYLYTNQQNVLTPFELCISLVLKWQEYAGEIKNKYILALNLEIVEILIRDFGILPEMIEFLTDCSDKAKICEKMPQFKGVKVRYMKDFNSFLNGNEPRRFDAFLANFPYQTKSDEKHKKTQPIWDKFVDKSISVLKENGFLVAIHPSGWRNVNGMFEKTRELIQSKSVKFISINNADQGVKTFKCATRFDWYVLQNNDQKCVTDIQDESGELAKSDIRDLPFIPNAKIKRIFELVAKGNEEKIQVLWSCDYHTQAREKDGTISKEKNGNFIYPCVQHVDVDGEPSCVWYSSMNSRGHFGIPKVVFSSRQVGGTLIDSKGEYGMCQDCSAIVATKEELPLIKQAFDSQEFIDLMKFCDFGGNRDRYPRKIIAMFRRDFWKEFVR